MPPYSTHTLIGNWIEDRQAPSLQIARTLRPSDSLTLNRITRVKSIPRDQKRVKFTDSLSVYKTDFAGDSASFKRGMKKPEFISESTIVEVLFEDRRPVDWVVNRAKNVTQKLTTSSPKTSAEPEMVKTPSHRRTSSLITRGNDCRKGGQIFNDWR